MVSMTRKSRAGGLRRSVLPVRLFLYVMFFGFLLLIVSVAVQLVYDYRSEIVDTERRFDTVEDTYVPALSQAIFDFDRQQVSLLLDGILALPTIDYARIGDHQGDVFMARGSAVTPAEDSAITERFPLDVEHKDTRRELGYLEVQVERAYIYDQLLERLATTVVVTLVQIFGVSLFLLLVVHLLISRRLKTISRFVRNMRLGTEPPAKLELSRAGPLRRRKDELEQIADAVNAMNESQTETYRDLMEAKESLAYTLGEREALLRELYHRTRNNMQVIISMLDLRSSAISHIPETRELVADTRTRIHSMALVHDKLVESGDLSRIDIRSYIDDLSGVVIANYTENSSVKPVVRLELERHLVLIDTAIPCGLVVTELLSNAVKHAFIDGRHGEIAISMSVSQEQRVRLSVGDNGVGVPEGFDFQANARLGVKTIIALVQEQLAGSVHFHTGPAGGVICDLEFPLTNYSERV